MKKQLSINTITSATSVIFLLLLFLTNCSQPKSKQSEPMKKENLGKVESIEIEATFVKQVRQRPPQSELLFDFKLKNGTDHPTWFLFPAWIGVDLLNKAGGVAGYEIFQFENDGSLVGRFIGNKSFFAVLADAHTEISLKNLPIKSAGEITGKSVGITVFTTEEIMINQLQMQDIFNSPNLPHSTGEKDFAHWKMVHSKFIQSLDEMPVRWEEVMQYPLQVSIKE